MQFAGVTSATVPNTVQGFGEIIARQKSDTEIELGELLIAKSGNTKILLQAYDLSYGSQLSSQNLELISGMDLEENTDMQFMDPHLRNYKIAMLKSLISIDDKNAKTSKILPAFFSNLREVKKDDLNFLNKLVLPQYFLFSKSG